MRLGIVALVCLLAACEINNGVYFEISGTKKDVEFDELEFFFAKNIGKETPFTPERPYLAGSMALPETQRLFKRLFLDADLQALEPTKNLTFFLPPEGENLDPTYLLVVAWREGEVVGIGEVEDFQVLGDAAYVYQVTIEPLDFGFERWGDVVDETTRATGTDCVQWSRRRAGDSKISTYAIVREGNNDCDDLPAVADCDDLNFCTAADPMSCSKRTIGCIDKDACNIGTCVDGGMSAVGQMQTTTCTAHTCLPEFTCDPMLRCHDITQSDEFFACAIELTTPHTEVFMPVNAMTGELCTETFRVIPPTGYQCRTPKIEWPADGMVSAEHTFFVERSTVNTQACDFTIYGSEIPPNMAHLVVSVQQGSSMTVRTSFIIGFTPYANGDCTPTVRPTIFPDPVVPAPTCP